MKAGPNVDVTILESPSGYKRNQKEAAGRLFEVFAHCDTLIKNIRKGCWITEGREWVVATE